jgi:alpha-amylase
MQNGTIIQYFHWYLPDDGTLWKQLKEQAAGLKKLGITAVWIPPISKGASGGLSVGYDVYDLFDLGEFDQKSSVRTKYGTKKELESACKSLKQEGLQLYIDVVLNHKGGADETENMTAVEVDQEDRNKIVNEPFSMEAYTKFTFPGRGDKYSSFKWDHTCFKGVDYAVNLSRSGIFHINNGHEKMWEDMTTDEKGNYDYLMYCDLEFRNKLVREECKYWAKWLYDLLGFDGVRLDAVKHITPGFYNEWLDDLRAHAGRDLFAVGEYWAPGRLDLLEGYLAATNGRMSLLDSSLHQKLHAAAKMGKNFDLRSLLDNSLVKANPQKAVTVVENHDTQPLQALEAPVDPWFKPHAYALILLRDGGYPVVFYPDLVGANYWDIGGDGNQYEIFIPKVEHIDALIKVRSELAYGKQRDYFDHGNTIGWTRAGSAHKKHSGCAVLLCNGADGFKKMEIGKRHKGKTFVDITGYRKEKVVIQEDGWGEFPVAAGKIAVWVRIETLPIF